MQKESIIAIFCYKRADKLKGCIEALLKNPECPEHEIIFFSDGYKGDKDKQGVLETRAYIDGVTGFKKVYKQFRETNHGTGKNFEKGLAFLCENYERFIVVEDDLVVSNNYVSFMNQALDFYEKEKEVFCIAGFCFPLNVKDYTYDTFIYSRFTSWGWASWSDKVKHVNFNMDDLKKLSVTPGFKKQLNREGGELHRLLLKQIDGRVSTWDIQMQVHVSLHQLKVVYPVISKINNIGFDMDSTHTFGINYLKTPLDRSGKRTFSFCDVNLLEPRLRKQIFKPYRLDSLVKRKLINDCIELYMKIKQK